MNARADGEYINSPDDPRLAGMGQENVAGADQIARMRASTPDERLDALTAVVEFVEEGRAAVLKAR